MATTFIEKPPVELIVEPHVHRWTREEYYKMGDAGLFFGKHVELIEGQIIDKEDVPRVYLWTREEYYRMAEIGLFEGKRVELIEGQVIEMSAMKSPHVTGVTLAAEVLRVAFGEEWFVRVQAPLAIGVGGDPEPDIAVIAGSIRDYKDEHPKNADLVVEVSDTTLKYDRKRKASLYARAWIDEYWIINLKQRQLEVFRDPITDARAPLGFKYANRQIFKEGETVSPEAKPEAVIAVADLLP